MNTIYITRRETFNAAHKLWREDWSEEKNWEVFGKCSNKNWHGHNFAIYVTVKGEPSEDTGFVINLKELRKKHTFSPIGVVKNQIKKLNYLRSGC